MNSRASRVRRRPASQLLPTWLTWLIRVALCVFVAIPVLYLLVLSVSPEQAVDAGDLIPGSLEFGNYAAVWSEIGLLRGFGNSLVICGAAAAVSVLVATAAAYPLSRYRFHGSGVLFYGSLSLQLVPGPMLLIPLFVLYSLLRSVLGLEIIGSYWGLIITYIGFSLPLAMWLMVGYVRTIPPALDEAVRIDGGNGLTVFRRVILPLAVPGMIVAFVLSLLLGWNDVLFASVLTSPTTRTAAVDLQLYTLAQGDNLVPQYAHLMAAGVVMALPVVVIYLALQRYLVGGLAAGAVK
jgi:multiple sugar transport system permease protein